jgi:hypothetical protein
MIVLVEGGVRPPPVRWTGLRRRPTWSGDEVRASATAARHVMSLLDELNESPTAMRQAASLVDLARQAVDPRHGWPWAGAEGMAAQAKTYTLSTTSEHRLSSTPATSRSF